MILIQLRKFKKNVKFVHTKGQRKVFGNAGGVKIEPIFNFEPTYLMDYCSVELWWCHHMIMI